MKPIILLFVLASTFSIVACKKDKSAVSTNNNNNNNNNPTPPVNEYYFHFTLDDSTYNYNGDYSNQTNPGLALFSGFFSPAKKFDPYIQLYFSWDISNIPDIDDSLLQTLTGKKINFKLKDLCPYFAFYQGQAEYNIATFSDSISYIQLDTIALIKHDTLGIPCRQYTVTGSCDLALFKNSDTVSVTHHLTNGHFRIKMYCADTLAH